jgi:uncharacterized protein YkwD
MGPRTFRHSRFTLFTAGVAVIATLFLLTAAQADSLLEPCADEAALATAVQRLNELRQQGGAPCDGQAVERQLLRWDPRLAASALHLANDLALRDQLSHVDAQQRGLGARLRLAGYPAAGAGENLAAGQTDFDETLQAWQTSPAHCANLMQADFHDVGLACVQRHGSRYERFWVAHFGMPLEASTLNATRRDAVVAAAR